MQIGERIRLLRMQNGFSQGDIERATGLLRCYISRVEHGHTEPSLGTLEKFAVALKVPLYQLLCDPETPSAPGRKGKNGFKSRFAQELTRVADTISREDQALLMQIAEKMTRRREAVHLRPPAPQTTQKGLVDRQGGKPQGVPQ